ncbi:MAG: hypothetical protein PHY34_03410 [Patescibacteria group bacterium]|nr:hypothetical protein [Patescibacteria group bacterium]MDD5716077.1 hypothetical protein [Patescibacteria group bacterium]
MEQISHIRTTRFYKKTAILFCAFAVLLLVAILYYSLNKTTIAVTIGAQTRTVDFEVYADPTDEAAAGTMEDTIFGIAATTAADASETYDNTNEGGTVDSIATGTVTIRNTWSQPQPLSATTRLLTPEGVLFRIKNRVDVPANGSLENVEVYADVPGDSGNIGPKTFTIPGLSKELQQKITAESTTAMTGGTRTARVLTQDLVDNAKEKLEQQLLTQIQTTAELPSDIQAPNSIHLGKAVLVETTDTKISPAVGEVCDTFTLTMSANATVIFIDDNSLLSKALTSLTDSLADGEIISAYKSTDLTYTAETYSTDTKQAKLNVSLSVTAIPGSEHPLYNKEALAGKDSMEIESYFRSYDFVRNVSVNFSPFWVHTAPSVQSQIEIKVTME